MAASRAATTPPQHRLRRPSTHLTTVKGVHAVADDNPAAAGGAAPARPRGRAGDAWAAVELLLLLKAVGASGSSVRF
jgi:hypothetical protein